MNDRWKAVGRWALVPVAFVLSSLAVYVLGLGLFVYLESFEIHWAAAAHLNFPPSYLLKVSDLLQIFLLAVIWVVPVAWAVGFASRMRAGISVLWGLSISLMLTAVFVWFAREPFSRLFAVIASMVLIGGAIYFIAHKAHARSFMLVNLAVLVLLFIPRLTVLASVPKQPPIAHKVWSVVLQKGTWQAMNTGSEFGAARQLTFAGDRIIAVFDAGSAGYQGKDPMSNYRLLSLDCKTGAIKNRMEFVGRWGAMPYIYGIHNGKVALVNPGLVQILNPDLSPTGLKSGYKGMIETISPDGTTLGLQTSPGMTLLAADSLQPTGKLTESSPISISRKAALSRDITLDRSKSEEILPIEGTDGQRHMLLFPGNCSYPGGFLTGSFASHGVREDLSPEYGRTVNRKDK